jgi:tyrosinase
MRTSFLSASLAISAGVSALPQITPSTPLAPALPLSLFNTKKFATPLSLDDILGGNFPIPKVGEIIGDITKDLPIPKASSFLGGLFGDSKPEAAAQPKEESFHTLATSNTQAAAATCSNPRVRTEWDSYSTSDRQAFVDAVKCLMSKPASGQFKQAKSRYEDLVALHQTLTPNVHGNSKFLLWHRYYLFTFEDMLRSECGFNRNLPWWDETRYAGRFAASSIFSDQWLGGVNAGGNCITNGVSTSISLSSES